MCSAPWAHEPAVRRHSYALLAREFGLGQTAEFRAAVLASAGPVTA